MKSHRMGLPSTRSSRLVSQGAPRFCVLSLRPRQTDICSTYLQAWENEFVDLNVSVVSDWFFFLSLYRVVREALLQLGHYRCEER